MLITSEQDLRLVKEGGNKLAQIRDELKGYVTEGISAFEIDKKADELIKKSGGEASFKKVKGYSWATCINVNDGVVHGIPHKSLVFKQGDLVSVDVGLFYKGFHTDTSFSLQIGDDKKLDKFLKAGLESLQAGITNVKPGNRIYDISAGIHAVLQANNLNPVWSLTGHGIGRKLHEEPYIPCYAHGKYDQSPIILNGEMLALEVMYTTGSGDVVKEADGWTISSSDGKITGLFEDTVLVTEHGPLVLTKQS